MRIISVHHRLQMILEPGRILSDYEQHGVSWFGLFAEAVAIWLFSMASQKFRAARVSLTLLYFVAEITRTDETRGQNSASYTWNDIETFRSSMTAI